MWNRFNRNRRRLEYSYGKLDDRCDAGTGGGLALGSEPGLEAAPGSRPHRRLIQLRKALAADPFAAASILLGHDLVHGDCRGRIVEVEVYLGAEDPGSHAFRGQGHRNRTMFGPPGHAYVYFTYGNHWMLNVVAREEGNPSAILIRAARPLDGLDSMRGRRGSEIPDRGLLSGPGKICQALGIDRSHDGQELLSGGELRLEPGEPVPRILTGPRIGLTIGKGEEFPWRFVDAEQLEWVSARKTGLSAHT